MESLVQPDRLFSQCTYCQGRTARADGEEHEVEAEMGGECVVLRGGEVLALMAAGRSSRAGGCTSHEGRVSQWLCGTTVQLG